MADNSVFITGVADGAFESALGDLPPWATEATAESIESILRKTLSLQTKALSQLVKKATGGDKSPDAKGVNDELDKLVKNLKDENSQDPKRKKRNKEEEDEFGKRKKRWKNDKDNFDSKIFIDAALVKAGLAIKATFEDNVKTFNELTAAGVNVISGFAGQLDGFQSLRQLTAETGVRFTELAASMTKYSSSVNSFGVGKFAKTVGMASSNLTQFGFSSKESADLLGSYLSVQQNSADVNLKTAAETSEGLQKFGAGIFRLTMATGMSRAAIMANIESISKSTEANLLNGQIGGKAAQSTEAFLSSFKDQNIAKQILKLMTDPIKPLNETFMNLQKVGMGGFAQSFTTFSEGLKGMPEEMQAQQMKEYVKAHRGELEAEKQRLAMLKQAGVEGAAASLDFIVGITQQADAIKPLKEEEVQRLMASNKASKDLATAWEGLKSLLQRAFGPTATMLNLFTLGLKAVTVPLGWIIDLMDKMSEGLSAVVKELGIADSIDLAAWGGLALIVYALTKSLTLFGTSLTTVLGTLKNKLFGGAAAGKGKGWTTSLGADGSGGMGGKASKGPGALSKMGKGIGDLGKGLGAGLGGLLKNTLTGLADGLKALGDTKVLKGVVALAGIAGALWLTGKAIKEFVGLKWEDLAKAGAALLGLSVAGRIIGNAGPQIIKGAIAIGIMGASLWVIGKSLKEFVGLKWDDLEKAGAALLGLSVAGRIIGNSASQMIKGAVGLAAMGASLWVIGKSLKEFVGINWDDLARAGAAIVGLGVAGALAGSFAGEIALGALSLGLMAGAMWVTGEALKAFAGIKWEDMGKAAVALVGLGLAGAAAGAVAPLIALGALALGAMGAALWVIGKAISAVGDGVETLARGFKAFGEINGKNLLDVALGITALGGALVAFSAGSAISAVGGVFATLGNGISKLFGDGSALDQIKAFAAIGPGLQQTAGSLSVITNSLSSLSSTLGSFAGLDTLKSIVQTVNSIDIVKALAFGALAKLGAVSLPTPTPSPAGTSPVSTPKASELKSPSQVSTKESAGEQSIPKEQGKPLGAGKEKEAPEASINTALGYQSSILEQILLSTNNLVSVNKDLLKYARVQT